MIFSGSYHGSLLQFGAGGSPINVPHTYLVGNYNDPEEAERLIDLHGEDLACVIVEPMLGSGGSIPATPAFLTRLRDATTRAGTVLIFDEVMTSRFGRQGAGAMYGIAPDMMTLGKWVGGGMPIGVFGGRKRLMDIFDPSAPSFLAHPGTFNNNTLTMHAGQAALDQAFTSDIAEALHYRGDKLREQINVLCQKHDAPFQATGAGSLMTIHAVRGEITSPRDLTRGNDGAKELLFLDLLDMGFYIARRGFIALSVVIEDHHLQAFGDALEQILHERASVFATVEASSYQ
jgi:glutamate-1-semialdehyde 2,1-aminomutase